MPKINDIKIELISCPQCGQNFECDTKEYVAITYKPREKIARLDSGDWNIIFVYQKEHMECRCLTCNYKWDVYHKNEEGDKIIIQYFLTQFGKATEITTEEATSILKG